ncbi:transmembrane protein 116 [Osmerus mordax]|uniref:transmembrane protein 116 n=1 Tax=Osmerus mordax TaxID=8014 RepID=UPI00350E9B9C
MEGPFNVTQIETLSAIYIVSLSFSLIGSFSVLVVSIVKWQHLQRQVKPLVQLALADLLAASILMFTSCMNFFQPGTFYFVQSVTVCMRALPLSLMFYCVSSLFVMVYAWESKHAIEGWRERPANNEEPFCRRRVGAVHVLYAAVWLLPVVFYLLYTFTDTLTLAPIHPPKSDNLMKDRYCTSCIPLLHIWTDNCSNNEKIHDLLIRIIIFIFVIPVLVCCTVLYYKIGRWQLRYAEDGLFPVEGDGHSRRRLRGAFSLARNMVLVTIFCWTPVLLLIVLSVTNIPQQQLFPLYVIQAGTMSLQGFLNSVFYAWWRPNFRDAVLGERMPLIHTPLAFFDESLRPEPRPL